MGPGGTNSLYRAGPASQPRSPGAGRRHQEARSLSKRGARLWGARFKKPLHPELERFSNSLDVDFTLAPYDIAGSIAHAEGLRVARLLTDAQFKRIERALVRISRELERGEFEFADSDEDIHTAVERRLTELEPELGGRLHAGRSRNDQVALDLRLYTRAVASTLAGLLGEVVEALAAKAGAYAADPMPGYTHLQRGQPVTAGHVLLAHAEPLLRDGIRVKAAHDAAGEMPLGSAALAGSTLPIDRAAVAGALGFRRLTLNSVDAVADRDFLLDLLHACATIAIHLSRLGEEIVLWASTEFGFLRLADEIATGSSIMPQKRNPDVAELLRGRSGRAVSAYVGLATVLKGLPLAYDRDLQEDKVHTFAAAASCIDSLQAARLLANYIEFDRVRMAEAAADPDLLATDSAEKAVAEGRPFREAHSEIGLRVLEGRHEPPWDVAESLRRRDALGGPHPARVAAAARTARRKAAALRGWAERS